MSSEPFRQDHAYPGLGAYRVPFAPTMPSARPPESTPEHGAAPVSPAAWMSRRAPPAGVSVAEDVLFQAAVAVIRGLGK